MKKILLISSALFLIGCGSSDKDCNCTQQRWERKAIYTNPDTSTIPPKEPVFVSATEWEKKGSSEYYGNDCGKNGSVQKKGVSDSWPGSSTYTNLEFEYRVTCQ